MIDLVGLPRDLLLREVIQYALPPALREIATQRSIVLQHTQVIAQRRHITLRKNQARSADDIGNLAARGADDGHAAGHGLHQHDR